MPSAYRHGLATRSTRTMSFDWKAYDLFSLRLMMLWFSTQMWDHGDSTEHLPYEPTSAELHCQKHAEASLGPRTPHHKPTMILWHERITGFSLIDACPSVYGNLISGLPVSEQPPKCLSNLQFTSASRDGTKTNNWTSLYSEPKLWRRPKDGVPYRG